MLFLYALRSTIYDLQKRHRIQLRLPPLRRYEGEGGDEVGAARAFEDNLPAVGVVLTLIKCWSGAKDNDAGELLANAGGKCSRLTDCRSFGFV